MKRVLTLILALALVLGLTACAQKANEEAPDLQAYYDDFMSSLGDNAPMMMPLEGEMLEAAYPGIGAYSFKQSIFQMAGISAVAFEMALVEVEKEADVEAVKGIFQSRIDSQVDGGAMYPATIEAWQKAEVKVNGNVVALIVAGEEQTSAADAFDALFK